jgi:hypothetical protein
VELTPVADAAVPAQGQADLASQIDSLLDAAKSASTSAPAKSPPPAGIDAGGATPDDPDPRQLAQIDQLLAEHADAAIADELAQADAAPSADFDAAAAPLDDLSATVASVCGDPSGSDPCKAPAPSADADAPERSAPRTQRRRLAQMSLAQSRQLLTLQGLHQLCTVLDRPLRNASPQTRTLVGLIGLMTLGNACALLLYAFIA